MLVPTPAQSSDAGQARPRAGRRRGLEEALAAGVDRGMELLATLSSIVVDCRCAAGFRLSSAAGH